YIHTGNINKLIALNTNTVMPFNSLVGKDNDKSSCLYFPFRIKRALFYGFNNIVAYDHIGYHVRFDKCGCFRSEYNTRQSQMADMISLYHTVRGFDQNSSGPTVFYPAVAHGKPISVAVHIGQQITLRNMRYGIKFK